MYYIHILSITLIITIILYRHTALMIDYVTTNMWALLSICMASEVCNPM